MLSSILPRNGTYGKLHSHFQFHYRHSSSTHRKPRTLFNIIYIYIYKRIDHTRILISRPNSNFQRGLKFLPSLSNQIPPCNERNWRVSTRPRHNVRGIPQCWRDQSVDRNPGPGGSSGDIRYFQLYRERERERRL